MTALWPIVLVTLVPLLVLLGRRFLRWCEKRRRLERQLDLINEQYETLRSVRKDVVYHYGWAKSRGDFKEAESHEDHVEQIDKKLELLRKQYAAAEAGRLDDVASVQVDDGESREDSKDK
eukprot:gnl/TRDRNA2_/TRDRNA2_80214_c0_seq1.p2 gnl/TRDRNA2_/TRDRNA2_80214_c0~~gnl/TRDRNA2_/TRDRNA2_80214_c0_seq1.p2  ORF type:complete len:120 (-),score=27.84 gnl/TRDRNA2_/TRDRNA2_80214_c0_seq1:70-429(-)